MNWSTKIATKIVGFLFFQWNHKRFFFDDFESFTHFWFACHDRLKGWRWCLQFLTRRGTSALRSDMWWCREDDGMLGQGWVSCPSLIPQKNQQYTQTLALGPTWNHKLYNLMILKATMSAINITAMMTIIKSIRAMINPTYSFDFCSFCYYCYYNDHQHHK